MARPSAAGANEAAHISQGFRGQGVSAAPAGRAKITRRDHGLRCCARRHVWPAAFPALAVIRFLRVPNCGIRIIGR
jgi:hypothetical protein